MNKKNEKKKHEVLLLLLVLQELWTYQRFFLMAFKFYTFGSWFSYSHWVEVWYLYLWFVFYLLTLGRGFYQNLNFSFLRQVFQYYLLGFKACWLRFASTNPPIPQPYQHKPTNQLSTKIKGERRKRKKKKKEKLVSLF